MKILITGAGTMLGQPLAACLAARGHEVKGVYRSFNPWVERLKDCGKIVLHHADLAEAGAAPSALADGADMVFHLAATSPRPGIGVGDLIRDNIEVTRFLAEAALDAGIGRFVFMSSMSVYGEIDRTAVDENTPIVNPSPYGASKRMGEQLLEAMSDRMASLAIRLPALVGPGAHRHWLAQLVAAAKRDAEISYFNPDAPFNNAVHVDDQIAFLASLTEMDFQGHEAFPVGSKGWISVGSVVDTIVKGLGSKSAVVERESDATSFTIDYGFAARRFGYAPPDIKEVLARYVEDSR